MKRITILLLFIYVASAAPSSSHSKPWTFWYWMYGAVSKEGIKADLQAMKDVGLGGCYLMPIRSSAEKPEYEGKAEQLSPEFWEMVRYAMQQADSLGLEMGIHICDGFALAGGPWITPQSRCRKWCFPIPLSREIPSNSLTGSTDSHCRVRLLIKAIMKILPRLPSL